MLDLSKLKLEKFLTYNGYHIPEGFETHLTVSDNPDVYFLFCDTFEDVNRFTNLVLSNTIKKENRVFYIYKKGQKTLHRDHINAYIEQSPFLHRKAPILSSLGKTYSCFSTMIKK